MGCSERRWSGSGRASGANVYVYGCVRACEVSNVLVDVLGEVVQGKVECSRRGVPSLG